MKLTIELNDETLRRAIEQQLGSAVAAVTEQLITAKVTEIVDKKLGRLGDAEVQAALAEAASKELDRVLVAGSAYHRQQQIKQFIADAAVQVIKAAK